MTREFGSHCVAATFIGGVPAFALADGTLRRLHAQEECIRAHAALLAAQRIDGEDALLTSGEDGRVCRTLPGGGLQEMALVPRKWITSVAQTAGQLAYASGRNVWLHTADGVRLIAAKRNVKGIAFAPDGARLAVAQQGSIVIHRTVADADARDVLELMWSDIHHACTFSPDGRFLLVASQESFLHGWRLEDRQHFRMLGYAARVTDWAWSPDGKSLATSGAAAAIVWPFAGDSGAIGRSARELARRDDATVSAVAWHPRSALLAIGWSDGAVQCASVEEPEAPRTLRKKGRAHVTSLSFHPDGQAIAFGSAEGECGVLEVGA
jgi:WD40 repeat protein